jgi:hypothetical protein
MVIISEILYFMSHNKMLTTLLFILIIGILSFLFKNILYKIFCFILIILLPVANAFTIQFLNAWFLNKYGVESTAKIVSDVETNNTLNDFYIHDYETIVKKQDGKYITVKFSTTTAAIYPISNAIHIPSVGNTFPVKFIPNFETNIVILFDESEQGKALFRYKIQQPIETARLKYEADKTNKEFIDGYITALKTYTKLYDDEQTVSYQQKIVELEHERSQLK